MPAPSSRDFSHGGEAPTVMSWKSLPRYTGQRSGSSIWISTHSSPTSFGFVPGIGLTSAPVSAATSRAMPYTDVRSGRL